MAAIVARSFVISFDPEMTIGYVRFFLLICVTLKEAIDEVVIFLHLGCSSLDQVVLHCLDTFDHEDTRFTR